MNAKIAVSFYKDAEGAWKNAGRKGKPRFVCSAYYALGPNAAKKGSEYILDYCAFMGPSAQNTAKGILSTPADVENAVKSFSENGADELILWPTIPELEQVELASEYLK